MTSPFFVQLLLHLQQQDEDSINDDDESDAGTENNDKGAVALKVDNAAGHSESICPEASTLSCYRTLSSSSGSSSTSRCRPKRQRRRRRRKTPQIMVMVPSSPGASLMFSSPTSVASVMTSTQPQHFRPTYTTIASPRLSNSIKEQFCDNRLSPRSVSRANAPKPVRQHSVEDLSAYAKNTSAAICRGGGGRGPVMTLLEAATLNHLQPQRQRQQHSDSSYSTFDSQISTLTLTSSSELSESYMMQKQQQQQSSRTKAPIPRGMAKVLPSIAL